MIVPAYAGHIVPLEIFMARKFGIGFFGGLNFSPGIFFFGGGGGLEAQGIFGGFNFCPHSIIPVT